MKILPDLLCNEFARHKRSACPEFMLAVHISFRAIWKIIPNQLKCWIFSLVETFGPEKLVLCLLFNIVICADLHNNLISVTVTWFDTSKVIVYVSIMVVMLQMTSSVIYQNIKLKSLQNTAVSLCNYLVDVFLCLFGFSLKYNWCWTDACKKGIGGGHDGAKVVRHRRLTRWDTNHTIHNAGKPMFSM
jgi:hypothetical protein